jgi:hypothetical protein
MLILVSTRTTRLKEIIVCLFIENRMNALRDYHISTITLDVRISCDTFWNYKFNVPIRIDHYYDYEDTNIINIINNNPTRNGDNDESDTCRIGNIGRRDPRFVRLESFLVDHVIQGIYDDLIATRHHRDLPILLKKARKFHIHGRTLEDILFPNQNRQEGSGGMHSMPENTVYICTHC